MLESIAIVIVSIVSVQAQLTVTWNGTTITGPVLIYQDEIIPDNRDNVETDPPLDGTLICRHETQAQVGWHFANGQALSDTSTTNHFRQRRIGTTATPSVSRLTTNRPNQPFENIIGNGLCTCRLDGDFNSAIPVGIYIRGEDRGAITTNQVILSSSSSLMSDPPTFTLIGDTSGGPPTTYTWTRDGQVITNSASYSIALQLDLDNSDVFRESIYHSTLTVTGVLPGVYQYSVTNRATSGMVTDQMTIEFEAGPPPTDVTVQQTGLSTVFVMWTAPSPPPTDGYQVQITRGSTTTTVNVVGTSHTLSVNNQYGVYSIQVIALSRPLPSEATDPVEITVRGNRPPFVSTPSPTATSVTITWTQPEFSLPVVGYTVTVTRHTEISQALCLSFQNEQSTTTSPTRTATTFIGLQEFSSYTVRVTANFSPAFGLPGALMATGSETFTTLSSVPTGPPRDVTPSTTSRSVSVSWSTIECIEQNGAITDYTVVFQKQGGAVIPGGVNTIDRTFTASGLTPHTNYTFRIAGVNSNGTGPYTNTIVIVTDEEVSGVVSDFTGQHNFAPVYILTWCAPQEPNGVIISYEVTYRVSDANLVSTNTTDLSTTFTIPSLTPGTNVTEISVSAYTSVGRGDPIVLHTSPLSFTRIAQLKFCNLTATSLRVSWDRLDVPDVAGYIVYYNYVDSEMTTNEQSVNISSQDTSVIISNLISDVQYHFEVAAVADVAGDVVIGQRSPTSSALVLPSSLITGNSAETVALSVVLTFVLTLILYTTILLLVLCCVYRYQRTNNTKTTAERMNTQTPGVIYEEVNETRMDKGMEMKNNEAYGPVTSSQPPHAPSGTYEL